MDCPPFVGGRSRGLPGLVIGMSAEQSGKQGDQQDADQGDAAARHELLHTLGLCLCVIKKQ